MSNEKKNDGGPAFPQVDGGNTWGVGFGGMTLRDYFAAKAMQGDLAARPEGVAYEHMAGAAEYYYRLADSMLKAREE